MLGELEIPSCASVSNIFVSTICVARFLANDSSLQWKLYSFEN